MTWAGVAGWLASLPRGIVTRAVAIARLPTTFVLEEPHLPRKEGPPDESVRSAYQWVHYAAATVQSQVEPAVGKPQVQWVFRRVIDTFQQSGMLFYDAVIFNIIKAMVWFLGLADLITWAMPKLQALIALFVGKYTVQLPDGHTTKVYYSFANFVDINFSLPYNYREFPFHQASGPENPMESAVGKVAEAKRAHLLAMASKTAYEDVLLIQDVVKRWGFTWLDDQKAQHNSATLPETYWYSFYNAKSIVVCFRGTMPLSLVNWGSDIDGRSTYVRGLGHVHQGFYKVLFNRAQQQESLTNSTGWTSHDTVFSAIVAALRQDKVEGRDIYVTGHSLGAALASVFSAKLAVDQPDLGARLRGVHTYGQPRVGDEEYVNNFRRVLGDKCRRHVHAADLVTKIPVGFGYVHHGEERFLTSFASLSDGQELTIPDMVVTSEAREETWAPLFGILKVFWGRIPPAESYMRTVTRIALLLLPGINDHFPGDYETLLRDSVKRLGQNRGL